MKMSTSSRRGELHDSSSDTGRSKLFYHLQATHADTKILLWQEQDIKIQKQLSKDTTHTKGDPPYPFITHGTYIIHTHTQQKVDNNKDTHKSIIMLDTESPEYGSPSKNNRGKNSPPNKSHLGLCAKIDSQTKNCNNFSSN